MRVVKIDIIRSDRIGKGWAIGPGYSNMRSAPGASPNEEESAANARFPRKLWAISPDNFA
ncbi:hypothetical protein [Methylosinus sporium]|uniref:hypothetical protein n=1 Tax=Methylosinus sporium TaxID=428 RepID=UPI00383BC2BE